VKVKSGEYLFENCVSLKTQKGERNQKEVNCLMRSSSILIFISNERK